jgi:hypothetical protein
MQNHPAIQLIRNQLESSAPRESGLELNRFEVTPVDLPPTQEPSVLHVSEAIEKGFIVIEELPKPRVPTVRALNKGTVPVFFPSGVILTGGAQTRIVATPTLVMPGMQVDVSVRCVEAGRWSTRTGRRFDSARTGTSEFTRIKRRRDSHSRQLHSQRAPDQSETWSDVDRVLASKGLHSPTASLERVLHYESERTAIIRQRRSIQESTRIASATVGARGVTIAHAGRGLVNMELFGTSDLARKGIEMAIESVELETGNAAQSAKSASMTPQALAHAIQSSTREANWSIREEGEGILVDFSTPSGVQGTAFVFGQAVLQTTLSWAD